jgi:hypothetical protein
VGEALINGAHNGIQVTICFGGINHGQYRDLTGAGFSKNWGVEVRR